MGWIRQAEILIRHYLHRDPSEDFSAFQEEFGQALWMEEHMSDMMAVAVAKALRGKK